MTTSLVELTVEQFARQVADAVPTPGGGCVVSLAGALGAALCAMTARLTIGKEKYRSSWESMKDLEKRSEELLDRLIDLVDQDAQAYQKVIAALRLPKSTDEQRLARQESIQEAHKLAAAVPLSVLETLASLPDLLRSALDHGNPNCLTDIGVAVHLMRAAAIGAAYNVRINLSETNDLERGEGVTRQAERFLRLIETGAEELSHIIEEKLEL